MNSTYAICGTAFFIMFAFITATYGTGMALPWIALALLLAGVSQFFAQGATPMSHMIAWVSASIALMAAFGALVVFITDVSF